MGNGLLEAVINKIQDPVLIILLLVIFWLVCMNFWHMRNNAAVSKMYAAELKELRGAFKDVSVAIEKLSTLLGVIVYGRGGHVPD